MHSYVYRDQLLDQLTPLLQLLDVTPDQLISLRLHVHGIELDYFREPGRPETLEFAFYSIADRHQEHELTSETVKPSVAGSSPTGGAPEPGRSDRG